MIVTRSRWSWDDIEGLTASAPGEQLAFGPAGISSRKLAETLTAMANTHGGVVLVGLTAGGKPTGLPDEETTRQVAEAAGLLSSPPLILPLPQMVKLAGKTVCVVEVPPGLSHVYSLDGRYLTRQGAHNRLLSTAELSSLLLTRGEAGFESRPAPGATLDDLEAVTITRYLESMGAQAGADWQRQLLARGCLTQVGADLTPTHAGILLFGREPQQFLRHAEILLVRYSGPEMGDEFLRQETMGPLPEQIRQAEAFVTTNMRRGMRLKGFTREETSEYPLPVVREAIVNAVAHRDYGIRGDGIRVMMFSDHMEIYSPGRLPGHVTLSNLVRERFSRNEAVVQVLSDLGFVERLGYGIDRMVSAMADAGLPEPIFEETVAGFQVTLQGRGHELVSPQPAQRWGNQQVNPRQEQALAFLVEHGRITNRQFRDLTPEVSDETIRRELADLVDKGLIMKIGERRATYYILK